MIKPLDVARQLASWGFVVLPAKFREKAPSVAWKDYQTTPPSEADLERWFGDVAISNFWILCGSVSRLVVLDCDSKGALAWAKEHIGKEILEATPCVRTTKGWHFYFRLSDGEAVPQWSHHAEGVDLDVRSDGGGVVAPPSVHASGAGYRWERSPEDFELQPVPDALKRPLGASDGQNDAQGKKATRSTLAALLAAPAGEGGRNDWLAKVAGHYAKQLPHRDAYEQSVRMANACLSRPLPEAEVRKLIVSIWGKESRHNGGTRSLEHDWLPADQTESDVAHLFACHNAEKLWFVPKQGWLVYDEPTGRYLDDADGAMKLVQTCVERMRAAAAELGKDGREMVKFARTCSSARGLKAILSLAQIEPSLRLPATAFDADRTLLNCTNGVLDLETGELHPHSPKYRMTRLAGCAYEGPGDEEAAWKGCPRWLKHLDYVLGGDKQELLYLWRWFGRSLSGVSPSDNCRILMPIGTGHNGKTITVETIAAVLGEYAVSTNFTTWCANNYSGGDNPRRDLTRLGGARLVVTAESGQNHTLDEALIKQYTGGEMVAPRAHFAHTETVYRPQFSMLLSTNHEPKMTDNSDGFWRRIHKIVFRVSIPEDKQDKDLLEKLRAELTGILAWMAAGYREWRRRGLEAPESVRLATAESRRANDVVRQFIEECLEEAKGENVELSAVYARYRVWREECGIRAQLTREQLSIRLGEHGVERIKLQPSRRSALLNMRLCPSGQSSISSWLV